MESDVGVEMWLRSIKKNNLRYKTYIGDGDSSSYGKLSGREGRMCWSHPKEDGKWLTRVQKEKEGAKVG